jgi:hypothetical protein
MDIYSILASRPHNPHYLKRYIFFITKCQQINYEQPHIFESHHICPKANDMFPEYASFKKHPWNKANLTPRQHFIAHMILWKAFQSVPSACYAAHMMKTYQNKFVKNSKMYENLREQFIIQAKNRALNQHSNMSEKEKENRSKKISQKAKGHIQSKDLKGRVVKIPKEDFYKNEDLVGVTKGMTTVKDAHGVYHYVKTNDPRILNGDLVGPNKGRKFSNEVKQKLSKMRKGKKKGPMSLETKKKLSEAKKGKLFPKMCCILCKDEKEYNAGNLAKHWKRNH